MIRWVVANARAFLGYALPLAPLNALNWVMSLGSRYVLAAIADASAVGTYAAATALGSQPMIAANALVHTTLRPVLYDAVASGDRAKERRILRVWLAVTVAIAALGTAAYVVLAPWLTRLVLGPQFGDVAPLLPWIGMRVRAPGRPAHVRDDDVRPRTDAEAHGAPSGGRRRRDRRVPSPHPALRRDGRCVGHPRSDCRDLGDRGRHGVRRRGA